MEQNMIGNIFGKLKVLEIFKKNGKNYCKCICECGEEKEVFKYHLLSGHTKSCGCFQKEIAKKIGNSRKKEPNEIEEKDDYIIVKIESKGKKYDCLVDKEDYPKLKNYYWRIDQKGYVSGWVNKKEILIHRFLLNAQKDVEIDHINHQPLDNRKCNLRVSTHQQNMFNRKAKGITWDKARKKWVAQIMVNYKRIYLGGFVSKEEAVKARKEAEKKYFGEFQYKQ